MFRRFSLSEISSIFSRNCKHVLIFGWPINWRTADALLWILYTHSFGSLGSRPLVAQFSAFVRWLQCRSKKWILIFLNGWLIRWRHSKCRWDRMSNNRGWLSDQWWMNSGMFIHRRWHCANAWRGNISSNIRCARIIISRNKIVHWWWQQIIRRFCDIGHVKCC